ncbi:hypothetical protein ES702_02497 [subsurface metagenome]
MKLSVWTAIVHVMGRLGVWRRARFASLISDIVARARRLNIKCYNVNGGHGFTLRGEM